MDLPSAWDHRDGLLRLLAPVQTLALFTDLDGTISPIVSTPDIAEVIPGCCDALRSLAGLLPVVAVASGRPVSGTRAMVGVDGLTYIGNHGLEREPGPGPLAPDLDPALVCELQSALARRSGIVLEDKGSAIAVHYRLATDPELARAMVLEKVQSIADRYGLRLTEGRRVVELSPAIDVNKGTAVRAVLDEHPVVRSALYFGDDRTDADAFAALHRWAEGGTTAIAIAVLSWETPPEVLAGADMALQGVDGVQRFLTWLAAEVARRD